MELDEAKNKFIQAWGTLGSTWGINRTMAQIHALLLISNDPLSADDIMARLQISRGNVNMNVRELISWGLAQKEIITGERKEFFIAEKDVWTIAKRIARERRKREIEPVLNILEDLENASIESSESESKEFKKQVTELRKFTETADRILERFIRTEQNWLFNTMTKLIAKK